MQTSTSAKLPNAMQNAEEVGKPGILLSHSLWVGIVLAVIVVAIFWWVLS